MLYLMDASWLIRFGSMNVINDAFSSFVGE